MDGGLYPAYGGWKGRTYALFDDHEENQLWKPWTRRQPLQSRLTRYSTNIFFYFLITTLSPLDSLSLSALNVQVKVNILSIALIALQVMPSSHIIHLQSIEITLYATWNFKIIFLECWVIDIYIVFHFSFYGYGERLFAVQNNDGQVLRWPLQIYWQRTCSHQNIIFNTYSSKTAWPIVVAAASDLTIGSFHVHDNSLQLIKISEPSKTSFHTSDKKHSVYAFLL